MSKAEDPIDRAERVTRELREATREAAGVLKDLQAATRTARTQVDEYYEDKVRTTLDAHTRDWDAQLIERLKNMTRSVNETAAGVRDRAEAAITNATTVEGAAQHLATLIAARMREYPDGHRISYGELVNPDRLELG